MTSAGDDLDPAEARLARLFALLRADDERPDALTSRVLRRARVQSALLDVVRVVGAIAGAVADGVSVVLGPERTSRGRR